ncbi:hypothetical protein LCGC14_1906740 [marine sediment metagenome]|uniref:Conserved hypothetical protein CHP02391 domain-containing protein n=1 Tax=marine sediment metagenome TaxID=412755 RepID=A0A0F9FVB3_9ZZZZ
MKNSKNQTEDIKLPFKTRIINYFDNNSYNLFIVVIVIGLFLNIFLWLLTPIFTLPIYKLEDSSYDYDIRNDSYFVQEIRINHPVILPYSELFISYKGDNIIDVYILNSAQYTKYLEIKTQNGNLDDINYIWHHNNKLFGAFSLILDYNNLFNDPIYIVIEPNNNNVDLDISYKLISFERFWYLLSFIIIIILLCLLLIFRRTLNKNFPWNYFHDIITKNAYKLFKKGFLDKSIAAVDNEIEQMLKKVNTKKGLNRNFGVQLIDQLFSEDRPIIYLDDTSTIEGKDNQKDYKDYFKSCFKRIRNPFAHENFRLQKQETIRKLHLLDEMLIALDKGYILNDQGEKESIFEYIKS